MSDILELLRAAANHPSNQHGPNAWLDEAAATIAALTARVEELEGALRDLVRLVDEDQEEDVPPYLADQVLDRARAAITKGERE